MLRLSLCVLVLIVALPAVAQDGKVAMNKIEYGGWPNCIQLSNGTISLIATTDVGPRIIWFGPARGENLFKEYEDMVGQTGGDEWRIFGGHRLWHAPENMPRTYAPDNAPIEYEWDGETLHLSQPVEASTGIKKDMFITMSRDKNSVRVLHRLTNMNQWEITLAPWGLSVMREGGVGIFPQEEHRPHSEYLLPARPVVLWHYTDMSDPRWTWGEKFIQLRQDINADGPQKFGFLNKQGWMAYALNGNVFIKTCPHEEGAEYVDFGCNTESYTGSDMLELETVGPLTPLAPNGGSVEHVENWYVFDAEVGETDAAIDAALNPLLAQVEK